MGYSEIYCHICGVGFNISRFRTASEPRSAAWGNTGDGATEFSVFDDVEWSRCTGYEDGQPGCFFRRRAQDGGDDDAGTDSEAKKIFPEDQEKAKLIDGPLEHIPGPQCKSSWAYNGHRISVEAMRGCNTYQCLVQKREGWAPESDDEEFEASGHWFLSGLSDNMASRDAGSSSDVFPPRHDSGDPFAENHRWDDEAEYALPFHPACLEIYKRASLHRRGVIDMDGLGTEWWHREIDYENLDDVPRHPYVREAKEQFWEHNFGHEFLVANPCFVPGLHSLLASVVRDSNSPETRDNGIAVGADATLHGGDQADPFPRLPAEIIVMILSELGSTDIASLRLASRAFRQLPQAVFWGLTLRETPWLYEVWSSLPLSSWATTTEAELRRLGTEEAKRRAARINEEHARILERAGEIDWYRLQLELTRNLDKLQGLRNRRRIWDDCQEILNRIDAYRREGKDAES
jgi:hypothetical protein